jgi:mannose-6-phosphate isomerase
LAGTSLGELIAERGSELLGRHHPQVRFPLLLKFLDAARTLSVQVHPDDARAARLDPPDLGKTEAWVVLAAEPGSTIYAGLKPGVGREVLAEAIRGGRCQGLLHQFHPKRGDCVFLPAGTVHALGEGLLVAEIQQASDTTYRLFDWNRPGADGRPRPLHVEQALDVIDYDRGPVGPIAPQQTGRPGASCLVESAKFVLDRWELDAPELAAGDDRCHIISVLRGSLRVEGEASGRAVPLGGTVLVPASAGQVELSPQGHTVLIDAYLPQKRTGRLAPA